MSDANARIAELEGDLRIAEVLIERGNEENAKAWRAARAAEAERDRLAAAFQPEQLAKTIALALAAAYTTPRYSYNRITDTETITHTDPAQRTGDVMSVYYIAGDGSRSVRFVTCNEAATVAAAALEELAELDTTEEEIDAMMATGEPVELIDAPETDRG